MQKSLNSDMDRLQTLLAKYHSLIASDCSNDRIKCVKRKIMAYGKGAVIKAAKTMLKDKSKPLIFRLWCKMIVLTGEI